MIRRVKKNKKYSGKEKERGN